MVEYYYYSIGIGCVYLYLNSIIVFLRVRLVSTWGRCISSNFEVVISSTQFSLGLSLVRLSFHWGCH